MKQSTKRSKSRCARSEVDLHIHFDEEKSQNGKNTEPTQEEFFSPMEENYEPEPEVKPKKVRVKLMYQIEILFRLHERIKARLNIEVLMKARQTLTSVS